MTTRTLKILIIVFAVLSLLLFGIVGWANCSKKQEEKEYQDYIRQQMEYMMLHPDTYSKYDESKSMSTIEDVSPDSSVEILPIPDTLDLSEYTTIR